MRPRLEASLATTVIAFLVLVASCSPPAASPAPAIPVGSSSHTITVAGIARTFLVYRPGSLSPSRSVPLVVMIHGGGGTAAGAERSYGWDAEADSGRFIVAYPDGINHGWSVGGGCCHFTGSTTVTDDVACSISCATPLPRCRATLTELDRPCDAAPRCAISALPTAPGQRVARSDVSPCSHR